MPMAVEFARGEPDSACKDGCPDHAPNHTCAAAAKMMNIGHDAQLIIGSPWCGVLDRGTRSSSAFASGIQGRGMHVSPDSACMDSRTNHAPNHTCAAGLPSRLCYQWLGLIVCSAAGAVVS